MTCEQDGKILDNRDAGVADGGSLSSSKASNDPLPSVLDDSLWAILPSKLDEINAFLASRLNGEHVPYPEIAALTTKSGNRAGDSYLVQDGVAIIPVYGVLSKRMNLMTRVSGGTSTELLRRDIQAALNDPSVKAIVLDVDSPGGTVDGTKETADLILSGRSQKPIIAFANGTMASAAYWIGSAAGEIVAGETTGVGSLSVATMHIDRSGRDAQEGIRRTVITTGKYKAMASDEKPLSAEGRDYVLSLMQPVHDIFAQSVSNQRGMDLLTVSETVMDGRMFIGRQAKEVGLVDHIGTFEDAVALARQRAKERTMDVQKLKAEHPAVYEEIFQAGAKSTEGTVSELTAKIAQIEPRIKEAGTKGTQEERARVVKLLEAKADSDATLKAIKDGTPASEAFEAFYVAEREARAKSLADITASMPESAGGQGQPTGTAGSGSSNSDFMAEVKKYAEANGCSQAKAVLAVQKSNPELHKAWIENQREGK